MLVAFSVAPSGSTSAGDSVHDAVATYGTRVTLVLKADIRPGHSGELIGKVDRLERAINEQSARE